MRVFDIEIMEWWDNADPETEGCNDANIVRVISDDMDFAIAKAKEITLGNSFEWTDDDGSERVTEITFVKADSCTPVLNNIDAIADDIIDMVLENCQDIDCDSK